MTRAERTRGTALLTHVYRRTSGRSDEACVKASTHTICNGDCGRSHAFRFDRPKVDAIGVGWEAHGVIARLGGYANEPRIAADAVRGRIGEMREAERQARMGSSPQLRADADAKAKAVEVAAAKAQKRVQLMFELISARSGTKVRS